MIHRSVWLSPVARIGDDDLELRDMSRRFWVSAVPAAPILFPAMADMIPGGPVGHLISARAVIWLERRHDVKLGVGDRLQRSSLAQGGPVSVNAC